MSSNIYDIREFTQLNDFTRLFHQKFPQGAAVGLAGELGAGKTTFVRAFVESLCQDLVVPVPRVTSPSFVIHQNYLIHNRWIEHFDLYRLEQVGVDQLTEVGYFEALERIRESTGFLFVEWPARAVNLSLLELDVSLQLTLSGEDRQIELTRF